MKGIEVLAPAGGEESLRAAVFSGADAVYLGGQAFGARANAQNFDREALKRAVEFCHGRGVKVYVTVNTLLKETELPRVLKFAAYLCTLPVDAILVQDMGLFSLLRERAPDLVLHASTQVSLHTPDGLRLLFRLGASRVVLAREMSLNEIREAAKSCPIELEAFVHGALCMSVSGQCYLSAMLGGRSGNRGMCAQPCRLPFAAPGGTGHDLSLKDLSFLEEVKELERAGVCSAKIEGRMKRPEYVAAAVSACRKGADGEEIPRELLEDLQAVFSRSGFTKGYLTGQRGAAMFGVRTKEDVAGATEKVFSRLRGLYRGERGALPVTLRLWEGAEDVALSLEDGEGGKGVALAKRQEGLSPLSEERCAEQLKKLGGTPFFPKEVQVPREGVSLTVAALNGLRREAVEKLLSARERRPAIPWQEKPLCFPEHLVREAGPLPLRAAFRASSQVCEEAKGCEAIQLPLNTDLRELERLRDGGFPPILLELPRAMFGQQKAVEALLSERMEAGFSQVVCGNWGALETAGRLGAVPHGSFSLNVTNTAALELLASLGVKTAELSFELTGKELSLLGGTLPRGVMVYGRQALMLTRNCPLANSPKGCRNCTAPGFLTDRKKKRFPVVCTKIGSLRGVELLNSVPLALSGQEPELRWVDFGVCRFTVESPVESGTILKGLFTGDFSGSDWTRGLFYRGVE